MNSIKTKNSTKVRKRKSRAKITFRIYTIDQTLPMDEIQDSIELNTDEIIPEIYMLLLENKEMNNLDKIFDNYNKELSTTDVVEIQDKEGLSTFHFLSLFGFIEIEEFDKSIIIR
ncbi:YodL domain-containing protein [Clostridium sp.]|uniref:YodL domain-containing protein n=1 Tax=Clostridium sp. TaxID=1506 RepID=UPI001A4CC3DE|nr:YodL domain-containing protein [Clostridium sp.]MBK5240252.1 hypothetical protein [Clostridium sp.]